MASRVGSIVTRSRAWLNTLLLTLKTVPADPLFDTAKLRLLKDRTLTLNQNTTVAELEAHEADYDDYVAGGITVTPPSAVNFNSLSQGWVFSHLFSVVDPAPTIGNDIQGYWIDDGVSPVIMEYFAVGQGVPMQAQGDWLELEVADALNFLQGL